MTGLGGYGWLILMEPTKCPGPIVPTLREADLQEIWMGFNWFCWVFRMQSYPTVRGKSSQARFVWPTHF